MDQRLLSLDIHLFENWSSCINFYIGLVIFIISVKKCYEDMFNTHFFFFFCKHYCFQDLPCTLSCYFAVQLYIVWCGLSFNFKYFLWLI